jgi:alkanesulfonate monooxygenase SsuD/methylene tetrahydromethanopterin reductase-like flavin-dependent oxidoreductase (luciferase family)
VRLSTVILPHQRWHEGGRDTWRRAEQLGFAAAYTYDHLSWRSFRDGPWFGALPTLAAAAAVTERIRLGTLVTSPNFRHPVPLAKELVSLDDVSGGRLVLGVGSGGTGFDATAPGGPPWSPRERTERFEEFVELLDLLLTSPATASREGRFYSAHEVQNLPGCVQRPRVPFAVAAIGPRGLALAARYGQAWVTFGDPTLPEGASASQSRAALGDQVARLDEACERAGRTVLERILLVGTTTVAEQPLASVDAFVDFAGAHADLGFTEIVLHWPIPDSVFAADQRVFEAIATGYADPAQEPATRSSQTHS